MSEVIDAERRASKGSHDDVWAIIGPLQRDCEQAGKNLEQEDTPFNRRTYVRTVFASLEAVIYVLKRAALQSKEMGGFFHDEMSLLEEKSYSLAKGKVKAHDKFVRLDENFPFAIDMFSRVIGSPFTLNKASREWTAFKEAIPVRHRITHPKRPELLDISDDEIQTVGSAYRLVVRSIVDSLMEGHNLLGREVKEMCDKHGIPCSIDEIRR